MLDRNTANTADGDCFFVSDIGLLGAFTYFYLTLDAQRGAREGAGRKQYARIFRK